MDEPSEQRSLGIKLLDAENWLEPDNAAQVFAYITDEGEPRRMGGDEWARVFLAPRLSPQCPEEIVVAFETARGALVYGYYFYPLYALGQRELLQVGEMAVRIRCEQLDLPRRRTGTFAQRLAALEEAGGLNAEDAKAWTLLRRLRNSLVHTSSATIEMPGSAARVLRRVAELISALYT